MRSIEEACVGLCMTPVGGKGCARPGGAIPGGTGTVATGAPRADAPGARLVKWSLPNYDLSPVARVWDPWERGAVPCIYA